MCMRGFFYLVGVRAKKVPTAAFRPGGYLIVCFHSEALLCFSGKVTPPYEMLRGSEVSGLWAVPVGDGGWGLMGGWDCSPSACVIWEGDGSALGVEVRGLRTVLVQAGRE